jgi:hypothetical protein
MGNMPDLFKKLLFRLRWVVLSEEKKYACLWEITKRSMQQRKAELSANQSD